MIHSTQSIRMKETVRPAKAARLTEDIQNTKDSKISSFALMHPYAAFFCAAAGLPLFILAAVFAVTAAVMFPIAVFCGWV